MKLRAATAGLALLWVLGAPVCALDVTVAPGDYVIDQDQPADLVLIGRLSERELWQSFQQSSSVISGAGFSLFPGIGESGRIRIELWDGPPRAVPGTAKGDRLAFGDADGSAGQWVDVFWTPVGAKQDITYFLALSGMGQGNQLALGGAADVYPNGAVYVDGVQFPDFDAAFRTYGPVIPEPASGLLLSVGLALLAAFAFLRRRFRPR